MRRSGRRRGALGEARASAAVVVCSSRAVAVAAGPPGAPAGAAGPADDAYSGSGRQRVAIMTRESVVSRRFEPGTLTNEFRFWSICGILCAAPSFRIALHLGFNSGPSIAAMVAGIAGWIVLCTLAVSSRGYRRRIGTRRLGRRLRAVAVVRAGVALGAVNFPELPAVGFLLMPDVCSGIVAGGMVSLAAGCDIAEVPQQEYGWALLLTMVQGAWIVLEILLLAGLASMVPSRRSHKPVVS